MRMQLTSGSIHCVTVLENKYIKSEEYTCLVIVKEHCIGDED